MKTKFFITAVLTALLLTTVACNQETKKEAKSDVKEISDDFKKKKDKWVAKMKEEIDAIENRITGVGEDSKLEAELEQAKQKLEDNLEMVKGSTEDNWDKVKREVEKAYDEVEKGLNQMKENVEDTFDND